MKDYYFDGNQFIIENYLQKSTFSNFLPGLAGKKGIPLWTFYVNRGQGISGYGLQDKNHPIMEFTPANKAYESVGQIGFRTFMKVNGVYYEPFLPSNGYHHQMSIERASFFIEETNDDLGVKIKVKYFGLPNENIGALIRRVEIKNISKNPVSIEVLDGIAEILPSGVKNDNFKAMSNLLCSWMDVEELEHRYAFYSLRSSTGDQSEVKEIESGNYLFGIVNNKLVKPIVDQGIVFGYDNSKRTAVNFKEKSLLDLVESHQVTVNQIPCGFIPYEGTLESDTSVHIDIVSGYTHNKTFLNQFIQRASNSEYIVNKEIEAKKIIEDIVDEVDTQTGSNIFNEYIKQSYLDNLLRGGYPYKIGNSIYHLYSRRHGDLERDYNFFSLAPEFYSQGGGNFRDVCQNRRMDSFIHPELKSHNVKHFASLIQLDGYNPLTINGMTYEIVDDKTRQTLVDTYFSSKKSLVFDFLSCRFSPGGLVNYVANNNIESKVSEEEYLEAIINHSKANIESAFGEGYWVDHFTYILDIVESYESIYPDKMKEVLFQEEDILTFESPVSVLKKNQKSVINSKGLIRQYGSLLHRDDEKIAALHLNPYGSNWVQANGGVYKTNLFTKLLILVLTKHSLLDSEELGIEMEANKPGWNDAMNGLPGLFGSGVSETIELKRIVHYLNSHFIDEEITLPKEVFELFQGLVNYNSYHERVELREGYRESVRFGLSGDFIKVNYLDLKNYLSSLDNSILSKLEGLYAGNDQIIPTFITYSVTNYNNVLEGGKPVIGNYGLPLVEPLDYKKRFLPNFLEAPARLMKIGFDKEKLRDMYRAIKRSDIYDEKLKIYKTSGKLEAEQYEIGRIRAFTEGWLERESDFLHMVYKYLYGLLKAGLYTEFYEELQHNFVCFMDPNVYKRNTLENSSFIAPTNNPNPQLHGKGFLPRLSGSTIEVLDIWTIMMTGGNPFKLKDGKLIFNVQPKIEKSFFKDDVTFSFRFLKNSYITYISEEPFDTFASCAVTKIELINKDVKEVFYQDYVTENHAIKIREGFYKEIKIYIKNK